MSRSGREVSSTTSRHHGQPPSRMTKRAAPPSSSAIRWGTWGRSYRSRHRWFVRAPAWAPQFWTTWTYSVWPACPRVADGAPARAQQLGDRVGADRVQRPMLARRRDRRPPAARRPGLRQRDLHHAGVEGARLGVRADDVERVVLERPDADAVAGRIAAVLALAAVVDRLGLEGEPVAMEGAVDDRGHPPAGDRVLAQLEQAGRHRSGSPVRRSRAGRPESAQLGAEVVGERPGEDASRPFHARVRETGVEADARRGIMSRPVVLERGSVPRLRRRDAPEGIRGIDGSRGAERGRRERLERRGRRDRRGRRKRRGRA